MQELKLQEFFLNKKSITKNVLLSKLSVAEIACKAYLGIVFNTNYLISLILKGYLYSFPSLALIVAIITNTSAAIPTIHAIKIPTMVIKRPITIIITVI